MKSLQKLLGGFCNPRKPEPSDDDTLTDGTHISEPDLTSQVNIDDEHEEGEEEVVVEQKPEPELQAQAQSQEMEQELEFCDKETSDAQSTVETNSIEEDDEGEEVALHDLIKSTEKQPEIKATNLSRRKRVIRGLGVAIVAILVVVATLFTLHRLGYKLADFTFTPSDASKDSSSKPLITIQYNEQKIHTVEKVDTVEELQTTVVPLEADTSEDYITEGTKEVDRAKEKLEELRSLVADIQRGSEL